MGAFLIFGRVHKMNKKLLPTIALAVLLIISLSMVVYLYAQNQDLNLQLNGHGSYSDTELYYQTLQHIQADNINNTFAPPVSMYRALTTGFEYTGWTHDQIMELNATRVDIKLVYGYIDQASHRTVIAGALATPRADYSRFVVDGITYRYMWQIVAYNEASDLMPLTHDGYCLVDAVTGESLPIPAS